MAAKKAGAKKTVPKKSAGKKAAASAKKTSTPEKAPADTSRHLHAPMPGLLISLSVTLGQEVKAGEELVVLEAMKMENTLRAERNGTVAKIHFEPGASVEVGDTLLEFE